MLASHTHTLGEVLSKKRKEKKRKEKKRKEKKRKEKKRKEKKRKEKKRKEKKRKEKKRKDTIDMERIGAITYKIKMSVEHIHMRVIS